MITIVDESNIEDSMDGKLLGKCGFYCGCCPTYIKGGCKGCTEEREMGF